MKKYYSIEKVYHKNNNKISIVSLNKPIKSTKKLAVIFNKNPLFGDEAIICKVKKNKILKDKKILQLNVTNDKISLVMKTLGYEVKLKLSDEYKNKIRDIVDSVANEYNLPVNRNKLLYLFRDIRHRLNNELSNDRTLVNIENKKEPTYLIFETCYGETLNYARRYAAGKYLKRSKK